MCYPGYLAAVGNSTGEWSPLSGQQSQLQVSWFSQQEVEQQPVTKFSVMDVFLTSSMCIYAAPYESESAHMTEKEQNN